MHQTTLYLILADLILLSHILVVAFVVGGLLLTLLGGACGWVWVRNPWFRSLHVLCIAVVVTQAWAGVVCPLTTLEMWLREQGGGAVYAGSFISHWMQSLLYYQAPAWVFSTAYSVFGVMVVLSWWWIRPARFNGQ